MMKKTFVILLFAVSAHAQPADSLWTRYYDVGGAEICLGVDETSDQGLIMAGTAQFETDSRGFLVRTDQSGFPFWSRTYGDSSQAICVTQAQDGGFVLGGAISALSSTDLWLMKTNSAGDSLWSRTFGGAEYEDCRGIQELPDGSFILAGNTSSFGAGQSDVWLIKTDAIGGGLWTRTFGSDGNEYCYDVKHTSDNGFIIAAQTDSLGAWGEADGWLVKTNATGDTQWTRSFGGQAGEFFFSVDQAADGGYIAGGATLSDTPGSYDFFLVKTDANGNGQWTRRFGAVGDDECSEVRALADGGFILSGPTGSFGNNAYGTWVIRTNAQGDSLWSIVLRPDTTGYPFCATLVSDGGLVMAGGGYHLATGEQDALASKIEAIPLSAENDRVFIPAVLTMGNYPNPFNPATTIHFVVPRAGEVKLSIYDVTGRHVQTLINTIMTAGEHTVNFDGANLPSGLYLARLESGAVSATRKLMLVK